MFRSQTPAGADNQCSTWSTQKATLACLEHVHQILKVHAQPRLAVQAQARTLPIMSTTQVRFGRRQGEDGLWMSGSMTTRWPWGPEAERRPVSHSPCSSGTPPSPQRSRLQQASGGSRARRRSSASALQARTCNRSYRLARTAGRRGLQQQSARGKSLLWAEVCLHPPGRPSTTPG